MSRWDRVDPHPPPPPADPSAQASFSGNNTSLGGSFAGGAHPAQFAPPPLVNTGWSTTVPPHVAAQEQQATTGMAAFGCSEATRCLCVGNLAPIVSEHDVRAAFGSFGHIDSVRMVPAKTSAYVTYNDISCAFNAYRSLGGVVLCGQAITLNWARDAEWQPAPSQAPHPYTVPGSTYATPTPSMMPPPPLPPVAPAPQNLGDKIVPTLHVAPVEAPEDMNQVAAIGKLVDYCVKNGPQFEDLIRMKNLPNSEFGFLHDPQSQTYQWKSHCARMGIDSTAAAKVAEAVRNRPPPALLRAPPVTLGQSECEELLSLTEGYIEKKPNSRLDRVVDWISSHFAGNWSQIMFMLQQQCVSFPDTSSKLRVLEILDGFLPGLVRTERDAVLDNVKYITTEIGVSSRREERLPELVTVLEGWRRKGVYGSDAIDQLIRKAESDPDVTRALSGGRVVGDNNEIVEPDDRMRTSYIVEYMIHRRVPPYEMLDPVEVEDLVDDMQSDFQKKRTDLLDPSALSNKFPFLAQALQFYDDGDLSLPQMVHKLDALAVKEQNRRYHLQRQRMQIAPVQGESAAKDAPKVKHVDDGSGPNTGMHERAGLGAHEEQKTAKSELSAYDSYRRSLSMKYHSKW